MSDSGRQRGRSSYAWRRSSDVGRQTVGGAVLERRAGGGAAAGPDVCVPAHWRTALISVAHDSILTAVPLLPQVIVLWCCTFYIVASLCRLQVGTYLEDAVTSADLSRCRIVVRDCRSLGSQGMVFDLKDVQIILLARASSAWASGSRHGHCTLGTTYCTLRTGHTPPHGGLPHYPPHFHEG